MTKNLAKGFFPIFYRLLGEELLLCDTISLRAWQGQYVAAEANGAAMANRDSVGKKGRWKGVPKGDKIALKGVYGKHLAAESNGKANANRPWAYSWETFTPVHLGGNKYAFKTHHNTYLVAGKDESLNSDSVLVEEWETFEVFCHTRKYFSTLFIYLQYDLNDTVWSSHQPTCVRRFTKIICLIKMKETRWKCLMRLQTTMIMKGKQK